MTREEEYTQAASYYILSPVAPVGSEKLAYGDFINGVKWADKHPREGLWDSEKVKEWLRNNSSKYMVEGINYPHYAYNALVDDLLKAMED